MTSIKFATYNVRGLADAKKRREIFHYIHVKKFDVTFIQETHSCKQNAKWWSTQFGTKIWFSHGETNARGVAILFSKSIKVKVHNVIQDERGRFLLLYLTINDGHKFLLANVYAPNKDDPEFIEDIFKEIYRFTPDFIILGGDLNLALDTRLDRMGMTTNNDKAANKINKHSETLNLLDVWRVMNPDLNGYTWRKLNPVAFSRLDYWLISETFLQYVVKNYILPGFRTDHSIVVVEIDYHVKKKGPGYWKFNTSLLKDSDYVSKINQLIEIHTEEELAASKKDRWELLKLSIRGTTLQFAARKQKAKRNLIGVLEAKLKKLELELINKTCLFQDTTDQINMVKHELKELLQERTKGAQIRAKINYQMHGEKPSKYYLNLEKSNYNRRCISRLQNSQDKIVSSNEEILREIREFYKKLYTTKGEADLGYLDTVDIPKISDEVRTKLDLPITMSEISAALKQLKNDTSPGTDGLQPNFYKFFWAKLKDLFYDMLQETVEDKKMHLTGRQGILSLLEKTNVNPLKLTSWRPLSLLNTDSKVFTKIIADRLQSTFPNIIHYTQTGFVKGRHLAENIMRINEAMNYCENNKIDGLLVSFDFYKAFDTVEWEALYASLKAFNFGDYFIDLVRIIFNDPVIFVSNNGYWDQSFSPTRGNRQGCCFSPSGFNCVVEILSLAIRQHKGIEGIKIGTEEIRSGQYADDLWATLKAKESNLQNILTELHKFYEFSGLKINLDKTKILKFGPHKDSDAKYYTMRKLYWSPKQIKILGIQIYPDSLVTYHENYISTLEKVDQILTGWKNRSSSIIGKIVIVNTLVNTLFTNKFMSLPSPPESFFKIYKRIILDYIWGEGKAKISYCKLIQHTEKLGLKLVDLKSKDLAIKAAWPIRWKDRKPEELKWIYTALPIKDERIWETNCKEKATQSYVERNSLSTIVSIWKAWSKITYKYPEEKDEILDSVLWGNSQILRQNRPIFDQRLLHSKINKIIDIYDTDKKCFYHYDKICNMYSNTTLTFLLYCSIIAAIPNMWKIILRNSEYNEPLDPYSKIEQYSKGKPASKKLYWKTIEMDYPVSTSAKLMWELELKIKLEEDLWWSLYPNICKYIKVPKLRAFQYRLLNHALTTNYKRNKWNKDISPLCTFCHNQPETTVHLLIECQHTQNIWKAFNRYFSRKLTKQLVITKENILLNNYQGICRKIVNTLICIMKQHIYASKCHEKIPNFVEFVSKVSDYCLVEKCIAYEHGYLKAYQKKWEKIFN